MASTPRSARSRSTPAPVDPPPMTTTPVLVSGIQEKGERTNAALSPHPSALSTTSRQRRRLRGSVPPRPSGVCGRLRLEDLVDLPVLAQLIERAPESRRQPGAVGGAQ